MSKYQKDLTKRSSLEIKKPYNDSVGPGYYNSSKGIADGLLPVPSTQTLGQLSSIDSQTRAKSVLRPSDHSSVFASRVQRPWNDQKSNHNFQANKLSQYYDEISRNNRSEINLIDKYQDMFPAKSQESQQFQQMVSQFRENEDDELNHSPFVIPGPGAYVDIYKTSAFQSEKAKFEHMGLARGRDEKVNREKQLEQLRGPGAYENRLIPIIVSNLRTSCNLCNLILNCFNTASQEPACGF